MTRRELFAGGAASMLAALVGKLGRREVPTVHLPNVQDGGSVTSQVEANQVVWTATGSTTSSDADTRIIYYKALGTNA